MRYILNSAVITSPGRYTYRLVEVEEAKDWLKAGPWTSTIGYQETAEALGSLLGVEIPVSRTQIKMGVGDEALIYRLTIRISDPATKGRIGDPEWLRSHSEIGILSRDAD